jgi:hypothetical protein
MKERISIEKELENITSRPTKMNQPLEKILGSDSSKRRFIHRITTEYDLVPLDSVCPTPDMDGIPGVKINTPLDLCTYATNPNNMNYSKRVSEDEMRSEYTGTEDERIANV